MASLAAARSRRIVTGVTIEAKKTNPCNQCRRRKTACDEGKPECKNCVMMHILCKYRPNRKKHGDNHKMHENIPLAQPALLPRLHKGVEDRIIWRHCNEFLGMTLTAEGRLQNAFKDIIIPLSEKDGGLTHSLLWVAALHIDFTTSYGTSILMSNPGLTAAAVRERSSYHHGCALKAFHGRDSDGDTSAYGAQALCFLLGGLITGEVNNGTYLMAYNNLRKSPPKNQALSSFIAEFFLYHALVDKLISSVTGLPDPGNSSLGLGNSSGQFIGTPRLFGVVDGFLSWIYQQSLKTQEVTFLEADDAIADWGFQLPKNGHCSLISLYKGMAQIHLAVTLSLPLLAYVHIVERSLGILRAFDVNDSNQTLLFLPCVIIGTACVTDMQRTSIRKAVDAVKSYTGFKNVDVMIDVLERRWERGTDE